ncbi:MAG: ABC transporter substrate-binding protein [Anaerolineales bacterium]|nr:ABC transporter substrate-binding protein [Anaerolineales bacterium]
MFKKRIVFICLILSLALAACGAEAQPKTYTVGVIMELAWLSPTYEAFKASMTELGYVEGQNITYVYDAKVTDGDQAAFDAEAKRMVEQKVDLIFAIGTLPTKAAKAAVEGTNIPVVFDPVINPVAEGLVQSIASPGGNVTGIQIISQTEKALEWALKIMPETEYIYSPHNPEDQFISSLMADFYANIPKQGVELLPASEVTTPEQMAAAVETLPEHTIIFFGLLSGNLEAGLDQLVAQADQYNVPIFATGRGGTTTFPVMDYTTTFAGQAAQGAKMVDRIFKGASPANTPVETAEYYLFINLKAAQTYDVTISDDILKQAFEIIR